MKSIRTLLKVIGSLLIGFALGLLIAIAGIAIFTDDTVAGFFDIFASTGIMELGVAFLVGVGALCVAIATLIPLHEAGHLVGGLLGGYKFVSFRIFNYTIIRTDNRLRIKKFAIAGTGGQCLLSPPDRPIEKIPTALYNLGGVLANILTLVLLLPIMWLPINPFISEAVLIFLLTNAIIILMNGIPLKLGGIGNDGHNMIEILRNPAAKSGMIAQLRANALIQNGMRPKDMPDDLFAVPEHINYKNALEISMPMMAASRLIDEMRFDEALEAFEKLYAVRSEIMPLYVKEIACELAYLRLVVGQTQKAEALLDKELRQYAESYRRFMSSKERLLFAIALYLDGNREKAVEIYDNLNARRNNYLLRGEVMSDLALMDANLHG
ncbi:MAG: hypothetical protein K2O38_00065 [Muribaculaceae bacterium]|nr:hypothetical protein [Muribaculaceae bacterium]MDE7110281.1 hypothetical protein [Muribaculaceae bacterium]